MSFKKTVRNIGIPILIALLVVILPISVTSVDVATSLTVISLLFAVLVGFFIAATTTNYFRVQSLLARETGDLITMYNLGTVIQPGIQKDLANAIDRYVIEGLDHELIDYIQKTTQSSMAILDVVDRVRPRTEAAHVLYQNLHQAKSDFIATRGEMPLATQPIITPGHWTVLGFLSGLVALLLLYIRNESLLSIVVVVFLTISLYIILVLLYELDRNYFAEEMLFENEQAIFLAIRKPRYYPWYALAGNRIPHPGYPFRTISPYVHSGKKAYDQLLIEDEQSLRTAIRRARLLG